MSFDSQLRTRRFDSYVSAVEQAMQAPYVAGALGDLSTRIAKVNANAFLPNIRDNHLEVPRSYRDDLEALALVPLTRSQAKSASPLVESITQSEVGPLRLMGKIAVSSVSGARMPTAEMIRWLREDDHEDEPVHASNLSDKAAARMVIGYSLEIDENDNNFFSTTRPVAVIDGDMLDDQDMWAKAATIAHEQVHALDALENPFLYATPLGGVSSEMVAYHVSDTLYSMTSQVSDARDMAHRVERWRLDNLGDGCFVPNDQQLGYIQHYV